MIVYFYGRQRVARWGTRSLSLLVENRTSYEFVVCSLVLYREDLAPGLQRLWCLFLFPIQQSSSSVPSLHSCLISEPKLSPVEGLWCFIWPCPVDIGEKLVFFSWAWKIHLQPYFPSLVAIFISYGDKPQIITVPKYLFWSFKPAFISSLLSPKVKACCVCMLCPLLFETAFRDEILTADSVCRCMVHPTCDALPFMFPRCLGSKVLWDFSGLTFIIIPVIPWWAKSEKSFAPVPPAGFCNESTIPISAVDGHWWHRALGCDNGWTCLSRSRGTEYLCSCLCSRWVFDSSCSYLGLNGPAVQTPLSTRLGVCGPSGLIFGGFTSSLPATERASWCLVLFRGGETAQLKTIWKRRSLKAERMRLPNDGKEIAYKYFLISFSSLLPSLLLCPSWLFYLKINIVFILCELCGEFQSIWNGKIDTKQ